MKDSPATPLDCAAAAKLLDRARRVILVSHEYTDGDDLGSMLALQFGLRELGKESCAVAHGGVPVNLLFLPGVSEVTESVPPGEYDAIVYLGCALPERAGPVGLKPGDRPTLNIDHHPDNARYGTVNLVDTSAAAAAAIAYRLLKFLNVPIVKPIAVNLLTGIFFDTGGFRHSNTSSEVLEVAAELMRRGARVDRISEYFFGRSELPKLRAWATALENARFDTDKQMIYSIVTEAELAAAGAQPEDLEGIAEVLNTVPEAKFSLFLKQRGDEVKGSLRSEQYKGVDVSAIAKTFGGGGHKLAAGFKLKGKIERTPEGWRIT